VQYGPSTPPQTTAHLKHMFPEYLNRLCANTEGLYVQEDVPSVYMRARGE